MTLTRLCPPGAQQMNRLETVDASIAETGELSFPITFPHLILFDINYDLPVNGVEISSSRSL